MSDKTKLPQDAVRVAAQHAFDLYNENVATHVDESRAVEATKGLIFSNKPAVLDNGCVLIVNDHLQWLIAKAEQNTKQAYCAPTEAQRDEATMAVAKELESIGVEGVLVSVKATTELQSVSDIPATLGIACRLTAVYEEALGGVE